MHPVTKKKNLWNAKKLNGNKIYCGIHQQHFATTQLSYQLKNNPEIIDQQNQYISKRERNVN